MHSELQRLSRESIFEAGEEEAYFPVLKSMDIGAVTRDPSISDDLAKLLVPISL